MRATTITGAILLAMGLAAPVQAQGLTFDQVRPQPRPAPVRRRPVPVGFRAFFALDTTAMTAKDTFDGIFDSSQLVSFGGGADVLNVWQRLFVRGAITTVKKDGQRIQFSDDEVIPIGIPLTVTLRPVELGAGWRFGRSPRDRAIPYAGGGALLVSVKQTSTVAGESPQSSSDSFTGAVLFGGVDVQLGGVAMAGAEVQYRAVPNALGDDTTPAKERNLGGVTLRVMVGVRIR